MTAPKTRTGIEVIEFFEERSSIREYCGGMARNYAELEAIKETCAKYGRWWRSVIDQHLEDRKRADAT